MIAACLLTFLQYLTTVSYLTFLELRLAHIDGEGIGYGFFIPGWYLIPNAEIPRATYRFLYAAILFQTLMLVTTWPVARTIKKVLERRF